MRSDRQRNGVGVGDLKPLTRILNLRIEENKGYARNGTDVVALRLNAIDELPGLRIGAAHLVVVAFKKIETLSERRQFAQVDATRRLANRGNGFHTEGEGYGTLRFHNDWLSAGGYAKIAARVAKRQVRRPAHDGNADRRISGPRP